jgi:hypothetical protein
MTADAEQPAAPVPVKSSGRASLGLPAELCAHCMGRPESPASTATATLQKAESKRALELVATRTTSITPRVNNFTQPVLYRQGAPPGAVTPKHLLTGALLI